MLATMADIATERWTLTDHLLAVLVDAVNRAGHNALIGPHADPKKLRHLKPPEPIERPGVQRHRGTTLGELKQMMGGRHG